MHESLYDLRYGNPGDVKWPYLSLKIPPHCPEIFKNTIYDINFQIITNESLLGKTKSRQGRKGRAGWKFSLSHTPRLNSLYKWHLSSPQVFSSSFIIQWGAPSHIIEVWMQGGWPSRQLYSSSSHSIASAISTKWWANGYCCKIWGDSRQCLVIDIFWQKLMPN